MLQFVMRDLLEKEDIEKIRGVIQTEAEKGDKRTSRTIVAVRKQLEQLATNEKKKPPKNAPGGNKGDPTATGDNSSDEDDSDSDREVDISVMQQTGGKFGKKFDFNPYLKSLTEGENGKELNKRAKCSVCNESPKSPWLTNCNHLICHPCYEERVFRAAEIGQESAVCGKCQHPFLYAQPCSESGELEDFPDYHAPTTRGRKKKRNPTSVSPGDEELPDDWLAFDGREVLPSAKTIAIKSQMLNWFAQSNDVKVIIYTQFLGM